MSRFLDPKELMAVRNLQLAAKTTVEGFMAGINKSKVKGPGLEFSQYRSYEPGDDLRWLDWKMYARSDRYYVRESEIETSISVRFLIDASASMAHRDQGFTKLEYACYLTACLAWLANTQNDSIGLNVLQDNLLYALPSKKDHQHFNRFFYQLEQIRPGGKFTEPVRYKDLFAGAAKRELLIFITDFYQKNSEIYDLIDRLAALRHEIIVFHIMSENEMDLNYKGYAVLEDLESGESVNFDEKEIKELYSVNLNRFIGTVRTHLLGKGIYYRLMNTLQPVGEALKDFLRQRNTLKI